MRWAVLRLFKQLSRRTGLGKSGIPWGDDGRDNDGGDDGGDDGGEDGGEDDTLFSPSIDLLVI